MGSSYGGNTPCVRIDTGSDDWLIFDAGSGIRVLGQEIMKMGLTDQTFHLFFLTYTMTIYKAYRSLPRLIYLEIKLLFTAVMMI